MLKLNRLATALILSILLGAANGPLLIVSAAPLGATSPTLGASAPFVLLAGTAITNVPTSAITGDVGLSPASGSLYSGLTTSDMVSGTIYAVDGAGPAGSVISPTLLTAAQSDNSAVFTALGGQSCSTTFPGVKDLGGLSLVAGVYCADAFLLTGNLTLSGTGVWIFKSAATLTTAANSHIFGGDPCSVWWRLVSSGTLGTGTDFIGNIFASTSIHLQTGAHLNGRAFAQTANVTLDNNTISAPICGVRGIPTDTPTPTTTTTRTPTTTTTPTTTATTTATPSGTPPNTPTATNTQAAPPPAPQATATPVPTETPIPAPTEIATLPAVVGLPATGGGPLPGSEIPWSQALAAGGLGLLALGLGVRSYRRRGHGPTR